MVDRSLNVEFCSAVRNGCTVTVSRVLASLGLREARRVGGRTRVFGIRIQPLTPGNVPYS